MKKCIVVSVLIIAFCCGFVGLVQADLDDGFI